MKKLVLSLCVICAFFSNSLFSQISGDNQVCQYDTAYYHSGVPAGSYTHNWSATGGYIFYQNGATIGIRWLFNLSASVNVVIRDTTGALHQTDNISVTITPSPVPFITSSFESACSVENDNGFAILEDSTGCLTVCDSMVVTYQTTLNTGSTYDWIVVGAASVDTNNNEITVTWGSTGLGSVQVTETNSNGCTGKFKACVNIIDRPVADFTSVPAKSGSNEIVACKDQPIFFFDSSVDAVKWYWIFGDGGTSNLQNPTHSYAISGNYSAKLIAENSCGCTDTLDYTVSIGDDPAPDIYCVSTVCRGSDTYATSTACSTYSWSVIGGTIISSPDSASIIVNWGNNPSGYGVVTLDATGCTGYCSSNSVVVPTISNNVAMSGADTVCGSTQEYYEIPPAPGSVYNWTITGGTFAINGGTTLTDANQNRVAVNWDNSSTSGSLQVIVDNDPLNCADTVNKSVTILPRYSLSGPPEVCYQEQVSFTTSHSGSFNWQILDNANNTIYGPVAGANTLTYTFNSFGNFRVQALHGAGSFCNEIAEFETEVKPLAISPDSITGDTLICPDSYYLYEQGTPLGDYIVEWVFQNGTPDTVNGSKALVQWDQTGPWAIYTTYATATSPHCKSIPDTQLVYPLPNPKPVVLGTDSVCENTTFTYSTNKDADSYEWTIDPSNKGSITTGKFSSIAGIQWNGITTDKDSALVILSAKVCGEAKADTMKVFIQGRGEPEIFVDTTFCAGDTLTFEDIGSNNDTNVVSRFWNFGDGSTILDSTNSVDHIYTKNGNMGVSLKVTYDGLCAGERYDAINIRSNEIPNGRLGIDTTSKMCPAQGDTVIGKTMFLTLQGNTNDHNYDWYKGSNSLSLPLTTQSYDPTSLGSYKVKISNKNTGCSVFTNHILIDTCGGNPCVPVNATGTYTLTAQHQGCGLVEFTPSYTSRFKFSEIRYGEGAGYTSDSINLTHQYEKAGIYTAILIVSTPKVGGGVCTREASATFEIPLVPELDFRVDCNKPNYVVLVKDASTYLDTAPSFWQYWENGILGTQPSANGYVATPPAGKHIYKMRVTAGSSVCEVSDSITVGTPASADFEIFSSPYCEDSPIAFSDSSAGRIVKWEWDFFDGSNSDLQNPTRVYEGVASPFELMRPKLVVTDSTGCTDTLVDPIPINENELVNVNDEPQVSLQPQLPSVLCEGDSQQFTLSLNFGVGSSVDAVLWSTLDTTLSLQAKSTGYYWADVTDDDGCRQITDPVSLGVQPIPAVVIQGLKEEYCKGETVELNQYRGSHLSYRWYVNGTRLGNDSVFEYVAMNAGTDSVAAVAYDPNGCFDSVVVAVSIISGPNITSLTSSPNACESSDPTLSASATGTGSLVYNWSNGTSGSSTTVYTADRYQVTITDGKGCKTDSTIRIYPMPGFQNVMTGCYEFCTDSLNYDWQGLGFLFNHNWRGLSGTSSSSNAVYTINSKGLYEMELIGSNAGGCSDTSETINIDVIDCDCSEFSAPVIDSIWCISKDSNDIWTYGFQVVTNYTNLSTAQLGINVPTGTLSNISLTTVSIGDTIFGEFKPDTLNTDSLILDIRYNTAPNTPGICDFTIKDTLPNCYGPCEMNVSLDSIVCVMQQGDAVFSYRVSIENLSGIDYLLSVHPSDLANMDTGIVEIVAGNNTIDGLWRSNTTSDTCLRFSMYNEISGQCCKVDVCEDNLSGCSSSDCGGMSLLNEEKICVGKDTAGNWVFAFRLFYSGSLAATQNFIMFSDSAEFHGVYPRSLVPGGDTITGYFTYTGSSLQDFNYYIGSSGAYGSGKCGENFTFGDLDTTFANYDCNTPPTITDKECRGFDQNGDPIYRIHVEVLDWQNYRQISATTGDGKILEIYKTRVLAAGGAFPGSFYVDIAVADTTKDACIRIHTVKDDPFFNDPCHFDVCVSDYPACCDEDTITVSNRRKAPYFPPVEMLVEENRPGLKLIPNPAMDFTTIHFGFGAENENQIIVQSFYQHVVRKYENLGHSGKVLLETSNLPAGIYLVTALGADKTTSTQKLVVIK